MGELEIKLNKKDVNKLMSSLDWKQLKKTSQRAINRTLRDSKVMIRREIQQQVAIRKSISTNSKSSTPVKFINSRIKLKKAFRARYAEGTITISNRGISLARYSPKQTKKGVTVKIKKNSARKLIRGAFIANLKNNNPHVVRVTNRKIRALYSTNTKHAALNNLGKSIKKINQTLTSNLLKKIL